MWGVVALAIGARLHRRHPVGRDDLLLLLLGGGVLTLVSSQTGFNHHVRYAMPALPFLFIWASGVMAWDEPRARWVRTAALGCLIYAVLSVAAVFPFCMSYFNEFVGGPRNGHYHLDCSSTDWGQDAFELKRWHDARPDARPLYVDWESRIPLSLLEIDAARATSPLKPGWYAVTVNRLHNTYPELSDRRPVDWIGYSIVIYYID